MKILKKPKKTQIFFAECAFEFICRYDRNLYIILYTMQWLMKEYPWNIWGWNMNFLFFLPKLPVSHKKKIHFASYKCTLLKETSYRCVWGRQSKYYSLEKYPWKQHQSSKIHFKIRNCFFKSYIYNFSFQKMSRFYSI